MPPARMSSFWATTPGTSATSSAISTATRAPKKISVGTYDPNYYSAIFFAQQGAVSLTQADAFAVSTDIREDPDTKIYFDMIHPWTLFLEFGLKS